MTLHQPAVYITTPIYYINDRPHIGHLYTSVMADILARYYRMTGAEVVLATGTDEHGAKVAQAAQAKNQTPQMYVDDMVVHFQQLVEKANVQFDDFIRTTQERHHRCATALWDKLVKSNAIYKGHYAGWYAVRDEAYYDESDLIDTPQGRCAPTGAPVEWLQEDCYFFKLSEWQQPLIEYYRHNPDVIGPQHRMNEVVSFIERGLHDFAVSRTHVSWGIPVPNCPDQVMYVWIDALANYLTVLGYPDEESQKFQKFWPNCLHLLGKDILRFHAIYWPALLMAVGLPLPKRLFAHGWWMNEGQKMSKSIGNVIDPFMLIDTYGVDPVRYFLARHVRFGHDGDFQVRLVEQTYDSELVNGIGNLAHRVLTFVQSQYHGVVPCMHPDLVDDATAAILMWGHKNMQRMGNCMANQDIFGYVDTLMQGVATANGYISDQAPWRLLKQTDSESARGKADNVVSVLLVFLRDLATYIWPVMPQTAEKLWGMLGFTTPLSQWAQPGGGLMAEALDQKTMATESWLRQTLDVGMCLPVPAPLFPKRVVDETLNPR